MGESGASLSKLYPRRDDDMLAVSDRLECLPPNRFLRTDGARCFRVSMAPLSPGTGKEADCDGDSSSIELLIESICLRSAAASILDSSVFIQFSKFFETTSEGTSTAFLQLLPLADRGKGLFVLCGECNFELEEKQTTTADMSSQATD
mmetsp:Transcript_22799/g.74436  ORF Transcript_22799/g.74436 Transcript_22799/m.74436 type:complete len:148 (-) Transcript_22799:1209-1652(-)